MQTKTALIHLAFATAIALLDIGDAQARAVLFEEPRALRGDVINVNRDIVAETRLYCLSLAIYFEGGSTDEPEIGQRHVARVVVARAQANRAVWGGSNICDVVFYQRKKTCQFSFACLPVAKRTPRGGPAWRYSMDIARDEIEGRSQIEERSIRYYMNAALTPPRNACRFRKEFVPVVQAGRHEFFREASAAERSELAKLEHAECKRQAEVKKKKKTAKTKNKTIAAKKQPLKKVTVAKR